MLISYFTSAKQDIVNISPDSLLNIEISGTAEYGQTSSRTTAAVSIITARNIKRFGYRTPDEAVNGLCGFYGSYDRNHSYPGLHGFGSRLVRFAQVVESE